VDLLASFALFDDDPTLINRIESEFRAIKPEMISEVARLYLQDSQKSVLIVEPGKAATGAKP
jgi:predicted Zn-dependent peptidase